MKTLNLDRALTECLLQVDVQTSFSSISDDMIQINNDLAETMDLMHKTYEIVLDQRYKQGIECIEDAHNNLMLGSHNLKDTLPLLENFMFELQTTAIGALKPAKVEKYLMALLKFQGADTAKIVFNYVIVVKAKYLQLVSVFYIHKKDMVRIEREFQIFNTDFQKLQEVYLKLFDEKYDPENVPEVPEDLPTHPPVCVLNEQSVDYVTIDDIKNNHVALEMVEGKNNPIRCILFIIIFKRFYPIINILFWYKMFITGQNVIFAVDTKKGMEKIDANQSKNDIALEMSDSKKVSHL